MKAAWFRQRFSGQSGATAIAALVIAGTLIPRFLAIFTESINWDEFALLARAESTLRLGQVAGGGRPGLTSLVLVPFVRDCTDSVRAVVQARALWFLVTVLYLVAIFLLVRRWYQRAGRPEHGILEGTLAVALLAFLPGFVVWSVQVRTDQAALAAAAWGGAVLLSPRTRTAAVAGVLFGLSVLFTQKALYVIGLAGVMYLTASMVRVGEALTDWRAEAKDVGSRSLLAAACGLAVVGSYLWLFPESTRIVSGGTLASSWDQMDWVRQRFGYRAYVAEAKVAYVHWLLLAGLVAMTLAAIVRRDWRELRILGASWAVLLLGALVVVVHGSSFPYFLMTAGLFPAVALGMAANGLLSRLQSARATVVALLLAALIAGSVGSTAQLLSGSQQLQRETMHWINDSGLSRLRGYQVEGALFCSGDPDPMPAMFSQQIERRSQSTPEYFDAFIEKFRERPIAYMVESYRMFEFPEVVRDFWDAHYVRAAGAVFVAGFNIPAGPGTSTVEVLVPGAYRWASLRPRRGGNIRVNGINLEPGDQVHLEPGQVVVESDSADATGRLVLALDPSPPPGIYPFYDPGQIRRLTSSQ